MLHIHFEFIVKQVNHSVQPQEFMFYTWGLNNITGLNILKKKGDKTTLWNIVSFPSFYKFKGLLEVNI